MAWQDIASTEIDQDSPVTEPLMNKYKDRDQYVRETLESMAWVTYALAI